MTTLLLVRHGQSLANQEGFFAGQLDVPLLSHGLRQAEVTARYLTEHYTIHKIYASDLQRAFHTALPASKILGIPVIPEPGLREIYAGAWEGVSFDTLVEKYPEDYATWRNDIMNACTDGGESVRDLSLRIRDTLKKIAEENPSSTVLIATHATPIRAMEAFVEQKPMWQVPWVSNASYSVLTYEDGVWAFPLVSQDAHLQELKTNFGANV